MELLKEMYGIIVTKNTLEKENLIKKVNKEVKESITSNRCLDIQESFR